MNEIEKELDELDDIIAGQNRQLEIGTTITTTLVSYFFILKKNAKQTMKKDNSNNLNMVKPSVMMKYHV